MDLDGPPQIFISLFPSLLSLCAVGAFSRFAGWNQSAQCENNGQATPAPLFGSFQDTQRKQKLHKVEECILFYAIFGRNLPLACLYALISLRAVRPPPSSPPTPLHGIGIPMEMVSAATRSTPLLYDRKHINMPNTYSTFVFLFCLLFFFYATAIQWKQQSLLHYSQLVQGFRLFF